MEVLRGGKGRDACGASQRPKGANLTVGLGGIVISSPQHQGTPALLVFLWQTLRSWVHKFLMDLLHHEDAFWQVVILELALQLGHLLMIGEWYLT